MSTIIAVTLSAYILGCVAAFAINMYDSIKHADDYTDMLVWIIISLIGSVLSWIAVGAFIYSKIKKNTKNTKKWN